jgi:hypothetical protein
MIAPFKFIDWYAFHAGYMFLPQRAGERTHGWK